MKSESNVKKIICGIDGAQLEEAVAHFSYLKRDFKHAVLRCPVCGQVYIPEELATGKMREVETALEDK
jgi:uncharacterized Zn finger protein